MRENKLTSEEKSTIDYYNKNLSSYIERTFHVEMEATRNRFLCHIPKQAKILDAGCGPGRDALAFTKQGYSVLGLDAAEEMVRYVSEELHIPAIKGVFQDLEFSEEFDGIWASASLVHILPTDLPEVFARFRRALKPTGVFAFSFKMGHGVKMEGARSFTFMDQKALEPYLEGFIMLDQWTQVPKEGVNIVPCTWLNTIVRKK